MRIMPWAFCFIPDHFKTQEMCIKGVEADPSSLRYVADRFKHKRCAIKHLRKTLPPCNTLPIGLW